MNLNHKNILFYKNENKVEKNVIAYCYPIDNSRTVFFNLASNDKKDIATFFHEVSHFTSTEDIFYLYSYHDENQIIITLNTILYTPNRIPDTIMNNYIREGLRLTPDTEIYPFYREMFSKKIRDPQWRANFINRNADSYAYITSLIDKSFALSSTRDIIQVDRVRREAQGEDYTMMLLKAAFRWTDNQFPENEEQYFL